VQGPRETRGLFSCRGGGGGEHVVLRGSILGVSGSGCGAHERPREICRICIRDGWERANFAARAESYGDDLTLEIQKGYYGRALDAARPTIPGPAGIAYPVYVVFLLAPLVGLPFHGVQIFFHWLLLGLTGRACGCGCECCDGDCRCWELRFALC